MFKESPKKFNPRGFRWGSVKKEGPFKNPAQVLERKGFPNPKGVSFKRKGPKRPRFGKKEKEKAR